jgi:hypothetical protein
VLALVAVVGLGAGVLTGGGGDADARGVNPAQLTRAGWTCFDVPGLGVHCQPRGAEASDASISLSVFDTTDPSSTDADFVGTELLIRADLYRGQPCPQEGMDHYHALDLFGDPAIDFYACHHS